MKKPTNRSTKRYTQIINPLINKHFPLLKKRNIRVKECPKLEFSADAFKLFSYLRIRTHPRLRAYSKNKLISLFAHELSHLEDWERMSWFDYYVLRDFKKLFRSYRKSEEEKADKNVVKIGYAHELYAQRKSRWMDKNPKYVKHKWRYMSPEEIKGYAIKIGKW